MQSDGDVIKKGEIRFIDGVPVIVMSQVLRRHAAYRVKGKWGKSYVVDGTALSTDPDQKSGLFGRPRK